MTPPERHAVPRDGFAVNGANPAGRRLRRSAASADDVAEIAELMAALARLRAAERQLSEASRKHMKMKGSDMRTLHFLIAEANHQNVATPSGISRHLGISSASTTKLLDRLEKSGHITRQPHPKDRRALAIAITADARKAAMEATARRNAQRVHAAVRLSRAERRVVIAFLNDMTEAISRLEEPFPNEESGAG